MNTIGTTNEHRVHVMVYHLSRCATRRKRMLEEPTAPTLHQVVTDK